MTPLFKKKISAFNAGKGMSQILHGSNVSEIFDLFGVKYLEVEKGFICKDSAHKVCETLCGVFWAVWIGIQKRGFQVPISNQIIDGILSMIEFPDIYVDMLKKLPKRIAEYNEIMQKYLSDFSRAIFCVTDKFCENVGAKMDVQDKMKIAMLLPLLMGLIDSTLRDIEKEFKIVESKVEITEDGFKVVENEH